jgi:MOSC domain-containing protein YiiM
VEEAVIIKGKIRAISVSHDKGTSKTNVPDAILEADYGIVGDAHAGARLRQVSLLAIESIRKMSDRGAQVEPGNFAENITTEGMELFDLPVGTRIAAGRTAVLEVTQIGKTCHSRCAIYQQLGDCIMPREGIFAKVVQGGRIRVNDAIEVIDDQGCGTDD